VYAQVITFEDGRPDRNRPKPVGSKRYEIDGDALG
jgi:hypothetical protein